MSSSAASLELVSDSGLDAFYTQLKRFPSNVKREVNGDAGEMSSMIGCLNQPLQLGYLNARHDGSATVNMRTVDSAWSVRVRFASVDYVATLDKTNSYFPGACYAQGFRDKDTYPPTIRVERKHVPLFGISVGDLLSHHYRLYHYHPRAQKRDAISSRKRERTVSRTVAVSDDNEKQSQSRTREPAVEQGRAKTTVGDAATVQQMTDDESANKDENKDKNKIDLVTEAEAKTRTRTRTRTKTDDDANGSATTSKKRNDSHALDDTDLLHWVHQALRVDTLNVDHRDWLGVDAGWTFSPWDSLRPQGFTTKLKHDFEGFCQRVIYFFADNLGTFHTSSETKIGIQREVVKRWRPEAHRCQAFFAKLATTTYVRKLLRYHLFNEDPELGSATHTVTQVLEFDTPRAVPDILRELFEQTGNPYLEDVRRAVTRTLNKRLQSMLQTSYKAAVFRHVGKLEDMPVFAFRNVYVKQWTLGGHLDSALHIMTRMDQRELFADPRRKWVSHKSGGKPTVGDKSWRWSRGYNGHKFHRRGEHKERSKHLQTQLRDFKV